MEDVDSEKQKPLRFNFQTPCLQLTKDESKARIRWQAKSNVIANHRQYMVNSVSKENHTSLYSLWTPSAEAKRKHVVLLAQLRQGTTWLNMYQITAKACEPEKPLPHDFAMPRWSHIPLIKRWLASIGSSEAQLSLNMRRI